MVGSGEGLPRLTRLVERIKLSWVDDKGVALSKSVVGLVDSGAEVSCIHTDFVKLVNKRGNRKPIATAGGAILAVSQILPLS